MQQLPFHVHQLIHLLVYARTRYVLSTYSRLWRSERKQQSLDLLSVTLGNGRNFPSTQHVELRAISLSKRPCVCTENDKGLPRKNNKQITATRRTIFSEKDKRNSGLVLCSFHDEIKVYFRLNHKRKNKNDENQISNSICSLYFKPSKSLPSLCLPLALFPKFWSPNWFNKIVIFLGFCLVLGSHFILFFLC